MSAGFITRYLIFSDTESGVCAQGGFNVMASGGLLSPFHFLANMKDSKVRKLICQKL